MTISRRVAAVSVAMLTQMHVAASRPSLEPSTPVRSAGASMVAVPDQVGSPESVPADETVGALPRIQIHGFVVQGAFVSTANDYVGHSSRGSVELFQAGLNISADFTERARVGLQLFSHDEGLYGDDINDHWLWKGHLIDGVASMFDGAVLDPTLNMAPSRTWGLFLANTSVTV